MQTDQLMTAIWIQPPSTLSPDHYTRMSDSVDELWKVLPIVLLEGPLDVAGAARSLCGLAAEEWDCLSDGAGSGDDPLSVVLGSEFLRFSEQRAALKDEFINRAREALGGHLPPLTA